MNSDLRILRFLPNFREIIFILTNVCYGVSMKLPFERENAMFIFVNELNNRLYSMRRDMYGFSLLCSFTK